MSHSETSVPEGWACPECGGDALFEDHSVCQRIKAKEAEVIVTDPKTGGKKGSKLPQLGAIEPLAIMEVAKVAGFGAGKYDRYNYLKGYKWSLSYDALHRHLALFWSGQDKDDESGLYHLAHAAWHCLALLSFTLFSLGTDDRWSPSSKSPSE